MYRIRAAGVLAGCKLFRNLYVDLQLTLLRHGKRGTGWEKKGQEITSRTFASA